MSAPKNMRWRPLRVGRSRGEPAETHPAALSSSTSNPSINIHFSGAEDVDVLQLIRRVEGRAIELGHTWDDQWIAQLAATAFTDRARLWYDLQDRATRSSWKNLRPALLQRFDGTGRGLETLPPLRDGSVTPLAADPFSNLLLDTCSTMVGRIKVVAAADGAHLGYIMKDLGLGFTALLEDTLLVECPPSNGSNEAVRLKIKRDRFDGTDSVYIGLCGGGSDGDFRPWIFCPAPANTPSISYGLSKVISGAYNVSSLVWTVNRLAGGAELQTVWPIGDGSFDQLVMGRSRSAAKRFGLGLHQGMRQSTGRTMDMLVGMTETKRNIYSAFQDLIPVRLHLEAI